MIENWTNYFSMNLKILFAAVISAQILNKQMKHFSDHGGRHFIGKA